VTKKREKEGEREEEVYYPPFLFPLYKKTHKSNKSLSTCSHVQCLMFVVKAEEKNMMVARKSRGVAMVLGIDRYAYCVPVLS